MSIIIGTSSNDDLNGTSGNDFIVGKRGDDTIIAGAGRDVVISGSGNDSIDGGAGNDCIVSGSGDDTVSGGAGCDYINSGSGDDSIDGGSDHDFIASGSGNDTVYGNTGSDFIITGYGNDIVFGGAGNDIIISGSGDDDVDGGSDNDFILSGSGNDILNGGAGKDTMYGGSGNDIYFVDNDSDKVKEFLNKGIDTVNSQINYSLNSNVENLVLTGSNDILATGNELNNIISGNEGNNILTGKQGNDELNGGLGNDAYIYNIGDGADIINEAGGLDEIIFGEGIAQADLTFEQVRNDLVISLSNATDSITVKDCFVAEANRVDSFKFADASVLNLDELFSQDLLIVGTAGDDSLVGGAGNDTIQGLAGNDILSGAEGNDSLEGGSGNDTLSGSNDADVLLGGSGDDTYFISNAVDHTVTELANEGIDKVVSSVDQTLSRNVENLELTSTAITGVGNDLNNEITGNAQNNILNGAAGNDVLDGAAGNNTLVGGAGDDTYMVNAASQTITELAAEGVDKVVSSVDQTLSRNVENLELTSTAITGVGNNLNNEITGNAKNNILDGAAGNNTLVGGAGDDQLNGGLGNDSYVFNLGDGTDVVNETGGQDEVLFGDGIVQADVTFEQSTDDLVVNLSNGTDSIIVKDWFISDAEKVESFKFTDGSVITSDEVLPPVAEDLLITGTANDDSLIGGAGNDTIDALAGADTMAGAAGNDIYIVDSIADVVQETQGQGIDLIKSGVNITAANNVENIELTSDYYDLINMNGTDLIVYGDPLDWADRMDYDQFADDCGIVSITNLLVRTGMDTTEEEQFEIATTHGYSGLTGATTIYQQMGLLEYHGISSDYYSFKAEDGEIPHLDPELNQVAQHIVDGKGIVISLDSDVLWYGEAFDISDHAILVTGCAFNAQTNLLEGFFIADSGRGYESDSARYLTAEELYNAVNIKTNSVWAGSYHVVTNEAVTIQHDDLIAIGNDLDNVLTGNDADNKLVDTLGRDTLIGGLGNDIYVVDNDLDYEIIENANEGIDTLQFQSSHTIVDEVANVEQYGLAGSDNINLTGNESANALVGGQGDNTLYGLGGDDSLTSLAGLDTLVGGVGNDLYVLKNSAASIVEAAGEGDDTIASAVSYTLTAGVEVETIQLTGSLKINATGNELDNTLIGNRARNILTDNEGNNILIGGEGSDILFGDVGNNTYVFDQKSSVDFVWDSGTTSTDIIQFEDDVDRDDIAFFFSDDSFMFGEGIPVLKVDYGHVTGRNLLEVYDHSKIEELRVTEGNLTYALDSSDISNIINEIASYNTSHADTIDSVEEVKANAELMTYINNSWSSV